MCKHKYKTQSATSNTKNCEWSGIFHKWNINQAELPVDDEDLCIFHSKNLKFKTDNDFGKWFELLLKYANEDESIEKIICNGFCILGTITDQEVTEKIRGIVSKERIIPEINKIIIHDTTFLKGIDFSNAVFIHNLEINNCTIKGDLNLDDTDFNEYFTLTNSILESDFSLNRAKLLYVTMSDNTFNYSFSFRDSVVKKPCYIGGNIYRHYADFSHSEFEDDANMPGNSFNGITFFQQSVFKGTAIFDECYLCNEISFDQTKFEYDVYFNDIKIRNNIMFIGKDINNRIFDNRVYITIDSEDFTGHILFQYANVICIEKTNREVLESYILDKRIEFGKGCILYNRVYSISISILDICSQLPSELAYTFAQYFNYECAIHLGVEIKKKTNNNWELIYYTDENISQNEFENMLNLKAKDFLSFIKEPFSIKNKSDLQYAEIWSKNYFNSARIPLNFLANQEKIDDAHDFMYQCLKPVLLDNGIMEYDVIRKIEQSYNAVFKSLPICFILSEKLEIKEVKAKGIIIGDNATQTNN